jgi:hypothetical protein
MLNHKIKSKISIGLYIVICSIIFYNRSDAVEIDILESHVSIDDKEIQSFYNRNHSFVTNFSSFPSNSYEFSTVYTEIWGKNMNDPYAENKIQGTATSFFVMRSEQESQTTSDLNYWPLNFVYKFSSKLPQLYLVSNRHITTNEVFNAEEPLYQRIGYVFYIHLMNAKKPYNPAGIQNRGNPRDTQNPYQAEFKLAKVSVPIESLSDECFFKSHPSLEIDVSAIKVEKIFESIYSKLQTDMLTDFLPYYFAFDIDKRHQSTLTDFVIGASLKMYGYPLGHNGYYTGLIRSGHLATSQPVWRSNKLFDFCTDMATSGGSSGSPVIIEVSSSPIFSGRPPEKKEKLAGILYAGPYNMADDMGLGYVLKIERILDVCDF